MFGFVILGSLVLGILSGGKLSRLGELRLPRFQWILGALLVKFVSGFLLTGRCVPSPLVCTLLSSAVYCMLFYGLHPNLRLPGLFLVTVGVFLNFLVIVANGGRMPVNLEGVNPALLESQVRALSTSFTHQQINDGVKLRLLADIFHWKIFCKTSTIFSLGDVLMAVGSFVLSSICFAMVSHKS